MPKEERTEIVLLTHGGWGRALIKGIEMILGKVDCVHEIALEPSHTLSEYMGMVDDYVQNLSSDSLIITDLIGGTPSNVAALIGNQTGIKVFSGLNAPMLLEAVIELQGDGTLDFDQVLSAGRGACVDVVEQVRQSMTQK